MPSNPAFFRKNGADFEYGIATVTASEGQDSADFLLDRRMDTAWVAADSEDANNTTLEIDMVETRKVTDILLLNHNLKAYTIQYWDAEAGDYADFPTPISETENTATSKWHRTGTVFTRKFLLTIQGTMEVDDDKVLHQFIATEMIGQFVQCPIVNRPRISRGLRDSRMLSGKSNITQTLKSYSAQIRFQSVHYAADAALIEELYDQTQGFLFYPSGGDETQFSSAREGWRASDIFLVRFTNPYEPEWLKGLYKSGIKLDIDVKEVIT
jgi:hypothetical protein